jgi:4-hydroxybenzoate polyprenyltransferase
MTNEARADSNQRSFMWHAQRYGGAVLICLAIWALSGFGYFWPAWVIVIGGLKLGFHARSVYGSNRYYDDDLDDLEPPPAPREPVGSRY